jgi:hypothetical protein
LQPFIVDRDSGSHLMLAPNAIPSPIANQNVGGEKQRGEGGLFV